MTGKELKKLTITTAAVALAAALDALPGWGCGSDGVAAVVDEDGGMVVWGWVSTCFHSPHRFSVHIYGI